MCICIHCRHELELSDIDCLVEYQNEGGLKAQTYCNSYWLTKEKKLADGPFAFLDSIPSIKKEVCLLSV